MNVKKVYRGKTVAEVLELLEQYGSRSYVIAGGTDAIIQLREKHIDPEVMVDISSVKEIQFIRESQDEIVIGGGTNFTSISESPMLQGRVKGLAQAARMVGSPQIRNTATIGGNICNASPAADIVPPLLALEAEVVIEKKGEKRRIPLDTFLMGKGKLDLKPEELVTAICFKRPKDGQGLGFGKLGLRKALAISRIATAIFISIDEKGTCKEIKIASGAVGTRGLREREVETIFTGKVLTEEVIDEGLQQLSHVVGQRLAGRSTADFKATAVKGICRQALLAALASCQA
ncbi:molybdopterin dehydrogenase, FAD-binding [Alkaliphilus metalliredigens QYMF]|uniref:Molybdopterin dehydrogenase, FAD-binding n=1 Tax=Alkaliphilus metalliredigens (strain QYMF) TaxID=293826 RepID=A6TWS4_ALKMQ|nr:FAD binding domain-containing protein [Alkaliphilus metalliredigens]ABR50642.1 molybdopterin dehydrogenase, FAD-binding [Alkaliphilus metalliredigens QYMF]